MLTEYRFGTKQAKHLFCRTCGVQSFYIPRSNPDGRAVTVACIDPGTVQSMDVRLFDGEKWEQAHTKSNIVSESKRK
ncbi:hypothetical protein WJX81_006597 [Elliptochloris bilobata]|uniref:CENP-V/GFA domain-containing protein n=1 Tax=Elliptochloris bilobata TaxID=381761 RepID=A0AAW1RW44_9CHLO